MNTIINPSVKLVNGHATTTSRKIAEHFGKRHTDVLRAIINLDCPPEFRQRNFASAHYNDEQGKPRQEYTITRDGFMLLAMGFTGKEAMQWKIAYLEAFNALEKAALDKAAAKAEAKKLPKPATPVELPDLEKLAMQQLTCKRFVLQFGEKGNAILTHINDDMHLLTLSSFEELLKRSGKVAVPIEAIRMIRGVEV